MAKNSGLILVVIVIAVVILGSNLSNFHLFDIGQTGILTRTTPTTVNGSSNFQVNYTVTGVTGKWGVIINENITGGCQFPSGSTNYRDVMTSLSGYTKNIVVTTPASGTCTLSGYYQFDFANASVSLPIRTINICTPVCTRPANLCQGSSSNGCGGICTWTVTQNTAYDLDCNNHVDDSEVLAAINSWLSNGISDGQLLTAVRTWIMT